MKRVANFVATLLFIFALYNIDSLNISRLENDVIQKMSQQEPPFSMKENSDVQPYLLNGQKAFEKPQIDISETYKYKRTRYVAFKNYLKNTWQVIGKTISFSVERTNPAFYFTLDVRKLTGQMYMPEVGNNVTNTLVDLYDMLTTRVVIVDNHPYVMKSEVVWTKQISLPFTSNSSSSVQRPVTGKPLDRVLQWENEILAASSKYGIEPAVIAGVIEQESGGNPNALSRTGAIGLMQLMPGTANGLGVNPFDPAQNINGGTKYLAIQLKRFGNLELALAAYNAGPGAVQNKKFMKYAETRGYISKIPRLIPKYRPYFNGTQAVTAKE